MYTRMTSELTVPAEFGGRFRWTAPEISGFRFGGRGLGHGGGLDVNEGVKDSRGFEGWLVSLGVSSSLDAN